MAEALQAKRALKTTVDIYVELKDGMSEERAKNLVNLHLDRIDNSVNDVHAEVKTDRTKMVQTIVGGA